MRPLRSHTSRLLRAIPAPTSAGAATITASVDLPDGRTLYTKTAAASSAYFENDGVNRPSVIPSDVDVFSGPAEESLFIVPAYKYPNTLSFELGACVRAGVRVRVRARVCARVIPACRIRFRPPHHSRYPTPPSRSDQVRPSDFRTAIRMRWTWRSTSMT